MFKIFDKLQCSVFDEIMNYPVTKELNIKHKGIKGNLKNNFTGLFFILSRSFVYDSIKMILLLQTYSGEQCNPWVYCYVFWGLGSFLAQLT